jgi:Tfp pilus assembly protein PilO
MNRFTLLLLSLFLLAAAMAIYGFLSFEISRAVSTASAARAQAQTSGAQALYRQSVSGFLNGTESDRAALTAFVPADQDVPAIIQEIEDAALREKVSTVIGSVSVASSSWAYHEPLEIQLSARGSFAGLATFATDLESLPHASHLSSFTAQSSGGHAWFAAYTVDFVKQKSSETLTP